VSEEFGVCQSKLPWCQFFYHDCDLLYSIIGFVSCHGVILLYSVPFYIFTSFS
jgi:hypothetical protein